MKLEYRDEIDGKLALSRKRATAQFGECPVFCGRLSLNLFRFKTLSFDHSF